MIDLSDLSPIEARLIARLLRDEGKTVKYKELWRAAGLMRLEESARVKNARIYMLRARRKLAGKLEIHNEYGVGYRAELV